MRYCSAYMAKKTPTRKGNAGRKRVSQSKKRPAASAKRKPARTHQPIVTLAGVRRFLRDRLGRQADDVWGMVLLVLAVLVGAAASVGRMARGDRY